MSAAAIVAEKLSKRYRLGGGASYATLREAIVDATATPWRTLRGRARGSRDDVLWALRDVSFRIDQGEVVGIIGRNGAGKSTLLKVLSRITEPTGGQARMVGRIGSLLEVGAGFHPELTGRENLYLNGAILGMRREEIRRKFDEIVAFAEVERFLDTPVKRYSSGMYVRLAFAVAAHLETEILLVDEVLAVGDNRFQRRCLGKMGEIGKQGRTVLFVSHAMAAVQALCTRAIVLESGEIAFDGEVQPAVEHYLRGDHSRPAVQPLEDVPGRKGDGSARFTAFWVEDAGGEPTTTVANGQACTLALSYRTPAGAPPPPDVSCTVTVRNVLGVRVFYHHNLLTGEPFHDLSREGQFRLHIPRLTLSSGDYQVDVHLSRDRGVTLLDGLDGAAGFEVCDGDFFGTGFEYRGGLNAAVMVDGSWEHVPGVPSESGESAEVNRG